MLDQLIYPLWYRWTGGAVNYLAAHRIKAWHVSLFGVGSALTSAALVWIDFTYSAVVFLLLSRIADGLDGSLARRGRPNALGALIDNVADFICYGIIVAAFALSRSENIVPGIILLLSFYLSGGSFLALAAIESSAKKRPKKKKPEGVIKGFIYDRGLMEGTETISFFIAFMIFPDQFPVLAGIFAFLCVVTIGLRLWQVHRWEDHEPSRD